MARIHEMQITPEERKINHDRMANLITVYLKKLYTHGNVQRLFLEWESVAQRIVSGEQLLEETQINLQGSHQQDSHFQALSDLYCLLVRLHGIYEGFFNDAFPPDEPERHRKAQTMIAKIREIRIA